MGKRRNGVIPNAHFKKHWEKFVRTWYDQPGKKQKRRAVRNAKALAITPRPVSGAVRPIVRCQTFKYNTKVRAGRGFTSEELKVINIENFVLFICEFRLLGLVEKWQEVLASQLIQEGRIDR